MKWKLAAIAILITALALGVGVAHALNLAPFVPKQGGTGTSTPPAYGQVLIGGKNGEYEFVASSTFVGPSFSTSSAAYWFGRQTTTGLAEGANLYFTPSRAVSALAGQNVSIFANNAGYITATGAPIQSVFGRTGTVSAQAGDYTTSQVTEGANLYFTNARAQGAIAVSGPPLTYSNGSIGIVPANAGQGGYLTSSDWASFNGKLSSTSLSGGSGISYSPSTGVLVNTGVTSVTAAYPLLVSAPNGSLFFSTAFSTTSNNTFSGTNVFSGSTGFGNATSSSFAITSLSSTLLKANAQGSIVPAISGVDFLTASTAVSSFNGRVGSVMPASGDYTTSLVPEGTNLYWTNARFDQRLSATTSLPNIVTLNSLSLPLSQTTGILGATQGGTGLSGSTAYGQLLIGNATGGWTQAATSSLGLPTFSGNNTWTGTNSLATTTASSLNKVIVVTGFPFAQNDTGINAAISLCSLLNSIGMCGEVYLPAGTYLTNSPIKMRNGVWLHGAGMYSTIIEAANLQPDFHMLINADQGATSDSNFGITDLEINGHDGFSGFTTGVNDGDGILLQSVNHYFIRNVYVYDVAYVALAISDTSGTNSYYQDYGTIDNFEVMGGAGGIINGVNTRFLNMSNLRIYDTSDDAVNMGERGSTQNNLNNAIIFKQSSSTITYSGSGVAFWGVSSSTVNNVSIQLPSFWKQRTQGDGTNYISGIAINPQHQDSSQSSRNLDISNITISGLGNGYAGVVSIASSSAGQLVGGALDVNMTNITVAGNSKAGIDFYGARRINLSNITTKNNSQSSALSNSGVLIEASNNVDISNLHSYDDQSSRTQAYGLLLAYSSFVNVVGGDVTNNGAGSIGYFGTSTYVTINNVQGAPSVLHNGFNQVLSSPSAAVNITQGLSTDYASSTLFSNFGTAYFGGIATSTFNAAGQLSLAGLSSTLLKTNGSNQVVAAAAGTDYAVPPSGNSLLYGNGAGGFSNASVSSVTGINFSAGTLSLANIPNSSLANSSVSINGTSINLGASATVTAASSTLLADSNTYNGNNTFTKALSLTSTIGTTTIAAGQGFTIGGSQLVMQQGSGFLGIGTSSPPSLVSAQKDQNGETAVALINRNNTAANTQTAVLFDGYRDSQNIWPIAKIQAQSMTSVAGELAQSGKLVFYTTNYSFDNLAARMVIMNDGKVGIGTTSPSATLSTQGNEFTTGGLGIGVLNTIGGTAFIQAAASSSVYNVFQIASSTGASVFAVRNSGVANFASTTPVTQLIGDFWFSLVQGVFAFFDGFTTHYVQSTTFVATADKTIATTTDTTPFGSGIGTTTIGANTVTVGKKFRVDGQGVFTTPTGNGASVNLKIAFVGSTTVTIDTENTGAFPASATNFPFNFWYVCTVRSMGVSGSVSCDGDFYFTTSIVTRQETPAGMHGTGTINWTVNQQVYPTASWSAVTSTQSATVSNSSITWLN